MKPWIVASAGVLLVELGRRSRAPLVYVLGAASVAAAGFMLGSSPRPEAPGGSVLREPVPGYGEA